MNGSRFSTYRAVLLLWRSCAGALLLLCGSNLAVGAQSNAAAASCETFMQKHYDAALRFQSTHDLSQATNEFRLFLAQALHCVANDRSQTGKYDASGPLFEKAVKLVPNDAALRLDYATAATAASDFVTAKRVAEETLSLLQTGADSATVAKAHHTLGRALLGLGEYKFARSEFESAVAAEASFENGYDLASAYILLGDVAATNRVFAEMLASFGDTAQIHMQFGRVYGEAHFPEEAIAEFNKAIAKDPTFPEAHYSLGASYLIRSGDTDFPRAEAEFRKELELHPGDYFSYSQLGYIAMSRHRLDEAVGYLTRAAQLDPQNPDNFLLLGQIYGDLNRLKDAEAALRNAIARTRDPSRNHFQIRGAHYQLGRLLLQRGDVAEGRKEMQITQDLLLQNRVQDEVNLTGRSVAGYKYPKTTSSALVNNEQARLAEQDFEKQVSPAIADAFNNLGAAAAGNKKYIEALDDFEQAYTWNPRLDGLDFNWGRTAYEAGLYRQAALCLGRFLEAHPESSGVREPLGMSRFLLEDYAGAVRALSPVESGLDATPLLAYAYAESLVRTGETEPGMERLRQLAVKHPEIAVVHRALGMAYADQRDSVRAEGELRAALRLRSSDVEAAYVLAVVLFDARKTDDAQQLLTGLARPDTLGNSQNAALYGRIAQLQLQHGNLEAAIENLEAAAHLSPDSASIHHDLVSAYKQALRPADAEREVKRYDALTPHATERGAGPKTAIAP